MKAILSTVDWLHRALDHDFCPQFNRWVYWLKHPLACLALAAVVALICGILVNPYALVLLALLVLVGLLGTVWPALTMSGIDCQLQFDHRRTREGEPVLVHLRVRNRWPWPAWGIYLQRGFVVCEGGVGGIALARVGAWACCEYSWAFAPPARGVFPSMPPVLETGFPFGICAASTPVSIVGELLVWPSSVRLGSLPDSVELLPHEEMVADRNVGEAGDIVGTRNFRQGDPLRRVHWGQTARYGRLIVSERQAPAACAIEILVDVDEPSHRGRHGGQTVDQVLRVAASICESLHAQHAHVKCRIGTQIIEIGESRNGLLRALDIMARVPVDGNQPGDRGCRFHGKSKSLPRITITTSTSFHRHLGHRHRSANERFVLVNPPAGALVPDTDAACGCHAWLELRSDEVVADCLPQRWRRSCLAR